MKRTMVIAVLAAMAFALLIGSCASGGKVSEADKEQKSMRVWEGDYYLFQFKQYDYERINGKRPDIFRPTKGSPNAPAGALIAVEQPRSLQRNGRPFDHTPSAGDIDRAIAAYEAVLVIDPSGTWNDTKGAVQIKLEEAKNLKQQHDQQAAKQLAAAEERRAQPLRDQDFEIKQNPDNTVTIVDFKLSDRDVVIPETLYGLPVSAIAEGTFRGRQAEEGRRGQTGTPARTIRSVVIPDTVTTIGANAFSDNPMTRVVIGKGVKAIPDSAFANNTRLTEITIPDTVTSIGNNAFKDCGLTSVTLGSGLLTIGNEAFANNKLTNVTIPNSVTAIGNSVFTGNSLTDLTLGSGIQTIGDNAFSDNEPPQGKPCGIFFNLHNLP